MHDLNHYITAARHNRLPQALDADGVATFADRSGTMMAMFAALVDRSPVAKSPDSVDDYAGDDGNRQFIDADDEGHLGTILDQMDMFKLAEDLMEVDPNNYGDMQAFIMRHQADIAGRVQAKADELRQKAEEEAEWEREANEGRVEFERTRGVA